jgi:hypothetical protein
MLLLEILSDAAIDAAWGDFYLGSYKTRRDLVNEAVWKVAIHASPGTVGKEILSRLGLCGPSLGGHFGDPLSFTNLGRNYFAALVKPPKHKAAVFSEIPLDIEGSNIAKTAWYPSERETQAMPPDAVVQALAEAMRIDEKVCFTNVQLAWDSADDGPSYVYEIRVKDGDKTHTIEIEYGPDLLLCEGLALPIGHATLWDFMRLCEMCDIPLVLSPYAEGLLV